MTTNFEILDTAKQSDRRRWAAAWAAWPNREVFAHPAYVELFSRTTDRSLCALLSGGDVPLVLFPFILRPLTQEPWVGATDEIFDIATPYGYGGPFALKPETDLAKDFWEHFDEWAQRRGVVTSFVRLSLFKEQTVPFRGDVLDKAPNIVRRLDLNADELWRDYAHKVRKNVKRAKKNGLRVEVDHEGRRLDDFLDTYTSTMDRREAGRGYYFPRSFFERIVRDIPGGFMFFHVLKDETVVSTELVLVSAEHIYSFLGGTRAEAFGLRPNDLLKHEVIRWGLSAKKKTFVLGGGYQPNDGIHRYKLSFAPSGEMPFQVGTRVFDEGRCAKLVEMRQEWEATKGQTWEPDPGFFPPYRA
jgi:hypothetical protein